MTGECAVDAPRVGFDRWLGLGIAGLADGPQCVLGDRQLDVISAVRHLQNPKLGACTAGKVFVDEQCLQHMHAGGGVDAEEVQFFDVEIERADFVAPDADTRVASENVRANPGAALRDAIAVGIARLERQIVR